MGISMKRIGLLLIIMLMAGVFAACGDTGGRDTSQETGQGDAAADNEANGNAGAGGEAKEGNGTAAEESATVAYTAANGVVQVPKHPQRIVVLADSYVGDFLALGLTPVGVTDSALLNPFFQGMTDGIENLGDGTSIEKILELQPDLIITFNGMENVEQLEKIAATIAIQYGEKDYREQLKEFSRITSTEDKANEWLTRWDNKIAENKPKVQAVVGDKTVSILNPYTKGLYAFGHNYGRGGEILYTEFGLKAPELIQKETIDNGVGWATLSLEKLPEYAGHYIFTCVWSGDDADPDVVYGSNIWKNLPAVKNNHVFNLDPKGAFFNDPVSLEAQLDFIVASFIGN